MSNQPPKDEKQCHDCHRVKISDDFYRDKRRADGLYAYCKSCHNERTKAYRRTETGLIQRAYSTQRSSSKHRNHPMPDYTLEELRHFVFNLDNFEELYTNWAESGFKRDLAPSLDRIDDYQPYTLSNMRLTTWAANKKRGHDDQKDGINNKNSRAVNQLTLDNELVQEHYSIRNASRITGVNNGDISSALSGKLQTAGGFRWQYV